MNNSNYQEVLSQDPIMKSLIAKHGPLELNSIHKSDYFRRLITSIIGQQLSIKAAATINSRMVVYFDDDPTPQKLLNCSLDDLRSLGISNRKGSYLKNLSEYAVEKPLEHLDELSNVMIIKELSSIKGIGTWTVKMFLIFALGRPNVRPFEDLTIRQQIKALYELGDDIDVKAFFLKQANLWSPYESIACLYLWKDRDSR
jgi:DNA-3-methyladenine glycosylase II